MKCGNLEEKVGATEREQMQEQIEGILRQARPNAPTAIQVRIPALAKNLENKLFSAAANLVEYSNRFTLQERLRGLIPQDSAQSNKARPRSKPALPKKRFESLTSNERRYETFGKRQRPIFSSSNDDLQALQKRPMFSPLVTGNETTVDIVGRNGKVTFHFSNPCSGPNDPPDDLDFEDGDEEESISSDDESVYSGSSDLDNDKTALATFHRTLNDAIVGSRDLKEIGSELRRVFTSCPALGQSFQQAISSAIITCMEVDAHTQKVVAPDVVFEKGVDNKDIEVVQGPRDVESPAESAISLLLTLCTEVCPKTTIDERLLDSILRLYTGHLCKLDDQIERYSMDYDPQLLRRCVDRFVLSKPELSITVVRTLLKSWPKDDSERQLRYLMQLESIVRVNTQTLTLIHLKHILLRLTKSCVRGNVHVQNCAMNFTYTLLGIYSEAKKSATKDQEKAEQLKAIYKAFGNMKLQLLAHRPRCWHPEIRSRTENLICRLQQIT